MLVVLSLLSLFVTVKGQTCYIGSVSHELDKETPSPGYWYLNLSSVSSCSGELEEYEVNYYDSSNSIGFYHVHVAMWEPGESNTSYTMINGTRETFWKFLFNGKQSLDSITRDISGIYIRKGTVIGVFFESGKRALPVLGETNSGSHSLCKLQGSIDIASLDCTSNSIQDNLVLHAQAKIGGLECSLLPNIQHGDVAYINGGDTQYGAKAQYTCNIGYELSGNEYRVCQSNQSWNGSQPSCQKISCGEPDNVPNGNHSGNTYTYGSITSYICNEGYELSGNSTAVCLANKSWSSIPTCKQVVCENISLSNGQLSNQDFSYSSIVSFTCDNGYVLNGSERLLCEGSGNWNGSVPVCAPVNCSDPGKPNNGEKIGESFSFGSEVKFICNEGYELSENRSIFCLANASWNDSIPDCSIISCNDPGKPENGVALVQNFTYNSIVTYSCDIGYNLNGSVSIICNSNKQWNSSIPNCIPVECDIPFKDKITVEMGGLFTYPSIVRYDCLSGYEQNGSNVLMCQDNGQWNATSPNCNPINCGDPGLPNNGTITSEISYTFGSVVVYKCNEGFEMSGWPAIECEEEKKWNYSIPQCRLTNCSVLTAPENGIMVGESYGYGSDVNFQCNLGYELNGNDSLFCTSEGIWDGMVPSCNLVNCESPAEPVNGGIIGENYTYGSVLKFECNDGYILSGSKTLKCTENGTWNATAAVCEVVNCSDPGIPDNGQRHGESFEYEANITFSCDNGYNLIGSKSISCQSNGIWSLSPPICSPVSCGNPGTPEKGQQNQNASYTFGSQIEFSCFSGYELNGSSSITCKDDGNWTGSLPNCTIISCEPPKQLINGIVLGSTYTYESNITFECNTGYSLQGSSSAICLSNKLWSNEGPSCLRHCSVPQATPMLFQSPSKSMYVEGDKVTFWCKKGYELKGSNELTCNSNGHWSGPVPTCELLATEGTSTITRAAPLTRSSSLYLTTVSIPSNTVAQENVPVPIYGAIVGVVIFIILLTVIALILLLFFVRRQRNKVKYDVQNPSSDNTVLNPMIHSNMYVSGAVIQTRSHHPDNQEKTDIAPSSYDVPLTMQREGMTSLRKKDSSSEPSNKIHYNQRNRTATTLEKKSLSSLGMPNIDPMELDLPPLVFETSFIGDDGVINQVYMENAEMNNIVSVNDTAYSDLGEASESAYHDTPFETKLKPSSHSSGVIENLVYMESNECKNKPGNDFNTESYSQLDQAAENTRTGVCQTDVVIDIENILYLEVKSEPSTTSLRRGSQSVQADAQKSGTAKRKTVIFEPPAEETNDLYMQMKRKNVKGIRLDCIIMGKTLGSGCFGNVNKAKMMTETGSDDTIDVAVKTLNDSATERDKVKFLQEAAVMAQFDHTNVLKLNGVVVTKSSCMIVTELMPKGDLQNVLTKMRPDPGLLTNEDMPYTLVNFCRQVCLGLSYLSQKGFVHRDIAARNILVNENNVCKVADFGLSRDLEEDDYYMANEGAKIPVKWTAPEALNYCKYSSASDVWSYGCLLYEIWGLGVKPFQEMTNMEAFRKVDEGYRLPPPPGCPKEFYNLMIQCWHPDKEERPNFEGIMLVLLMQDRLILSIPEEDLSTHPLAGTIGAPLEAGEKMYEKLQMTYKIND